MKKLTFQGIIFFIFFSILSAYAGEKDAFNYGPDGRNYFEFATDKIIVKFRKGISFDQKAKIISGFEYISPLNRTSVLPAPDVSILEIQNLNKIQIEDLLSKLQSDPDVDYANPFLIYKDGTCQGIQDRIIVRLKALQDYNRLTEVAKHFNVSVIERDDYDPKVFILGTTKNSKGNALEVANMIHETGLFEFSEPDFLLFLKKFNTNDTYLGYQWSLNNVGSSIHYNGTPGADMRVFSAWGINHGSSSVKVAIIDEGVDLNHPDLQANLLSGYDATGQGSGGGPSGNDAHGTACAGIVAAVGNNNQGVAGVAYGAKIIPVRIAYGNAQGNWVTSNTWIGNAINWAWNNAGADILSNSWGGGSSSSTINNAITSAVTSGRGGKGAPVLFAAGNDNGANSYPATLTNTISVIAMSMCYQRKSPSSCDGETWWGSNYGTGADIAAPGVKIFSTDISGSAGYSSGNYVSNFNGTSSATPNAAGVMALILSANPSLTYSQARFALESTCRKVGSYTYNSGVSGQPNGTWNTELGYGLVNAYQAIISVAPQAQNDAGISSVVSPVGSSCSGTINPVVTLNNFGSNTLTSVTINYRVDNGTLNTFNWTGSLASASSINVSLSSMNVSSGSHTFNVYTSNPNGNNDSNTSNDAKLSTFISATNALTLTIVLDNYPEETSWEVRDATSNVVASGGTYGNRPDGSTVIENFCVVTGCYSFIIYDAYGDGICCAYGQGSYVLKDNLTGSTLASGGSFGSSQTTSFCVTGTPPLNASFSSITNVSCNGGNNGSATVSASGGTVPYSYLWSNGASGTTASGLSAGTYSVIVTDANNNSATASVTITQPSLLSLSLSKTDVSCNGGNNGSAIAIASGGTVPYSYLWSNGGNNSSISGLSAGSYTVTVTDSKGCAKSASVTISQPSLLSVSASNTNVTCFGANNGTASVSAIGGTSPYNYLWSNGANGSSVSGLSAGNYTVTVTDSKGCAASTSVSISQPSAMALSLSSLPASCGNSQNGTVDLTVSGGSGSYVYSWSNGASTQDLNGVNSGNYSVTVTDISGCSTSSSVNVSEQSTLVVAASSSPVSCNGGNNGTASSSVNGGTAPFSYLWSNGASTSNISGLSSGGYAVTITDANGCIASTSTFVNQPAALSLILSSTIEGCNGNDGTAGVVVSGGTTPYSFVWNTGGNSATITGLSAGDYSLTVTDANGCIAGGSITVEYNCGGCSYLTINSNDFESGMGIWNDGGGDCFYSSNGTYSNNGTYSVMLRDNSGVGSSTTTNSLDLSVYDEVTIQFVFKTNSMENGEDFWLQYATSGSYTIVASYVAGSGYANGNFYTKSVVIPGPFSSNTTFRFVCDASDNSDQVYIDDIIIQGCLGSGPAPTCTDGIQNGLETGIDCGGSDCPACPSCSDGIQNGLETGIDCGGPDCIQCGRCAYATIDNNDFETSMGIWDNGGSDCFYSNNSTYATSGNYSIMLRDNSGVASSTTTSTIDLSLYDEVTIQFSFKTNSMETGEDFWLQYATSNSYTTAASYISGTNFSNGNFYSDAVVIPGPFSSITTFRFRCDASDNNDQVYIDDVVITGCLRSQARLGNFEQEETKVLYKSDNIESFNIYPNPVQSNLKVLFNSNSDKQVTLSITDLLGKNVYQNYFDAKEGYNSSEIELSQLTDGVYIITLDSGLNKTSKRLVVTK